MEKYLLFLIVYLPLVLNQNIRAQQVVQTNGDSLSIFLAKKDLVSYFKKITNLSSQAFATNDANRLSTLSNLLKQDFGALGPIERLALRRASMYMGSKICKLNDDYDEGLEIYLIAHDNVENKITLDTLAWFIENEISTLYTIKGDYELASYYSGLLEGSLKYYGRIDQLSRYYTNLGRQRNSEYKVEEAINLFERGYKLADSIDFKKGMFSNALNLAEVYNDYPSLGSAESFLLKAGEILPLLTSESRFLEKKSEFQIESANYMCIQGKYLESIPLYLEAIRTLGQYYPNTARREFAKYYTSLAKAYYKSDSLAAAHQTISLGFTSLIPEFKVGVEIPSSNQLFTENSFIDLLELKAQVFERQFTLSTDTGLLEKALMSIDLALHVNDLIRETILADPSKLISIRSNKELIDKGISILYKLYTAHKIPAYFDRARILFSRSKALLYSEKTRRNTLMEMISPIDREEWIALQNKIQELYNKKFDAGADINAINGEILSCEEKRAKIFEHYDDILLKTQMPGDYIEYFMTDDFIYAISEFGHQRKFMNIGSKTDFQMLADRMSDFILSKGFSMDHQVLNDMYGFLIHPLTDQLPAYTVIIPDGAIGFVPFEMLKNDQGKYLLELTTISYAFEYITYLKQTTVADKEWAIFCLAPQYKMKETKENENSRGGLYHLPYARMEVDSICHLYGNAVLSSQSDDKQVWQHDVSMSRIFHYAGHAIIKSDQAYLALNDTQIERQQLTAKEIGLMHNPLDLVVLSACETGLGRLEPGEGIRSLGRSFMESGAKATVISLWNVNDKSTAIIMTGFYK
ncbi:MAG: CHAT domain-containing protein, partial [Saprospiraceae bacterium]